MSKQAEHAKQFHKLHQPGHPVILFNAWDAGSAKAVAKAGAKAIATGSWSVAAAHGVDDGQALPMELALANLQRIVAAVDLPVTLDFEAGYGATPVAVRESVGQAVAAGAIGFNIEDRILPATGGKKILQPIEEQCARLRAAREACDAAQVPAFINARTDVFLRGSAETHTAEMADEAIERARAYAAAGASGLFVPGLVNDAWIGKVCQASPLPVNVMYLPALPGAKRLCELGVARISYGPYPYRQAMQFLEDAARAAMATVPA